MSFDFLFQFKLNKSMNRILEEKQKKIVSNLNKKLIESGQYIKTKMLEYAPFRTGGLYNAISSLPVRKTKGHGINILWNNGSIEYIIEFSRRKDNIIRWVNYGTGLYGPHGSMIYPKHKRFMYFYSSKYNSLIRVSETKGYKGKHFIEKAVNVSKLIIASKIRSALRS